MVAVAYPDTFAPTGHAFEDATRPRPHRRPSEPLVTGDRYELGETIGRGGQGEVISAYDAQIGRDVAVKRLLSSRPTPDALARFLREARIQGRLEHPAIPPVYELAADAHGQPYIVMKKLAGVTLADVLKNPAAHPAITRHRKLRAFVDICHAIQLAHEQGIVHRDLKPSNVLLGNHGEVYILDWGIARELDGSDHGNDAYGTPGYMAPEQARGDRDIDHRADIFALGCILHDLVSGRRSSVGARSTASSEPELDVIWQGATVPDRDERTGSARVLADAVQRFLDGDRDSARRHEIAAAHLAAAHAALAGEGDEDQRRTTAMREAGRALALDPSIPILAAAAALITRLVEEPPAEMPAVVAEELAVLDVTEDRKQLRMVIGMNLMMLLFIPLVALLGIRDVPYLTAYGVAISVLALTQIGAVRSERFMKHGWPIAVVAMFGMLVITARMWTPFLIAPAIGILGIMSFGMSSSARRPRVAIGAVVMVALAIFATFGAELLGICSRTTWIEHGTLVMRSPLDGIENFPVLGALVLFIVTLVASAGSIACVVSRQRHESREKLHVQSWQLRKLL